MTKSKQRKDSAGGRPLSYDPNLVHEIIYYGLANDIPAADLDASYVKERLLSKHGVKVTIRPEALKSLVEEAHAEIKEAKNIVLLKSLPDGVAAMVQKAIAVVGQELLLLVARQHASSQAMADATCQEMRADKRNAQYRITELEGELADERQTRNTLKKERDGLVEKLANVQEELRIALADMERLSAEPSSVDRLLAELRNPKVRNDIRATLSDIIAYPAPPAAE